ncbi:MAG: sugar phosphate isomerase/epimerase, partial [Thermoguttaceae bacterium]|nr:sugar phosphate isomerase/epimerase [Thermoguttaceae bacterium]
VKFDSDCLVSEVVEGDNTPFKEYIDLQNNATIQVRKCLEKLIPVAAYEGITIGVENVWNNLWCTPDFYAAFVSSFDNRWIKSYFDMGNHVKYAPTEEWIRALRGQITKLHIKDFAVDKNAPAGGTFVPIGKGDIKWQQVRDTLEEIGCSSWVTLESDGFTDEEHLQIFKDFFAGKPFSVQ